MGDQVDTQQPLMFAVPMRPEPIGSRERELDVVSCYAKLHNWRIELADVTNGVYYFRALNHKIVRTSIEDIVFELAAWAVDYLSDIHEKL